MSWGVSPWGTTPWGAALSLGGRIEIEVSDSLVVDASSIAEAMANLIDRIRLTDAPSAAASFYPTASDHLRVEDAVLAAWMMSASDSIEIDGSPTYTYKHLAALAETLLAADLVDCRLTAYETITEMVAVRDLLSGGWGVEAVDTVEFSAAFTVAMRVAADLVDTIVVSATPSCFATVTVLATDAIAVSDDAAARLSMMQNLSDDLALFVSVHADTGEYSSWVVNTETAAAAEYRNFDFNSLTTFNGKYYAAGDSGLVKLDSSNTDAGANIEAWIRSGLSNLGTGRKKGSMELYVGLTATGAMVLKAIVVADDAAGAAVKKEYFYRETKTSGAINQVRFKVGKGVEAVYWQFELHNQGGGDFDIDTVAWTPLTLSRRV